PLLSIGTKSDHNSPIGIIIGVLLTLVLQIVYFLLPVDLIESLKLKKGSNNESANVDNTKERFVLPIELRELLTENDSDGLQSAKESCISFSLLLQFLFQEFKNAKSFKRWILKKLQIDFNELMSRSLIGNKIIRDINVRRLEVGSRAPSLELLLTIKYEGDFALALDVTTLLGQQCSLSVSVSKLLGDEPVIDFNVQPTFRGRPMPHLIAVIMNQVRRTIRKRHVFPAYKLRFRPLIQHPLLQPSSDPNDFAHIDVKGVLKLTVKKCCRLNTVVSPFDHDEIFCVITSNEDPFNSSEKSVGSTVIALKFVGRIFNSDIGLTLSTKASESNKYVKQITVADIKKNSIVERAGFKVNDRILAVNNIPITTDRQAYRLLANTRGDVIAVVERNSSNELKMNQDTMDQKRLQSQVDKTHIEPKNSTDVAIDDTFTIPLSLFHHYITIRMFSRKRQTNAGVIAPFNEKEDCLLGYENIVTLLE
uniref:PDZ domain-containing protein n=1 Tax=Romanomermis culicivorax TaxID=13658 RepID=A0A915J258_ROMCU